MGEIDEEVEKMKKLGWIKSYLIVLAYILTLVSADLLLHYFVGYNVFVKRAILFSTATAGVFAAIGLLFKGIGRQIYYGVTAFLFALLGAGQVINYYFFKSFFSFSQVTNLGELGTVKGEIFRVLEWKYLLFFVPVVLLIALMIVLRQAMKRYKWDYIAIVLLVFGAIAGNWFTKTTFETNDSVSDKFKDDNYLYESLFDKGRAMERFGLYAYTKQDLMITIERNIAKKNAIAGENEEVDAFFEEQNRQHVANEMTGLFEGKNVVFVLAESLFNRGIDENMTPTLYKMIEEGLYFDNFYAPKYKASTSDTEFVVNTSLVPSVDYGTTSYDFAHNAFPNTLAQRFKEEGYTAQSFHSNTGDFYNRFNYHHALGYETFYDQTALGLEFLSDWEYMVNWPSDIDLIDAAADIFLQNEKFFSYIITTNGHTPYTTQRTELAHNYEYVRPFVAEHADEEIVYYYAAQNAFDESMARLIERLDEAGKLEETVIVIFGDHYPYPIHHEKIWGYDATDEYNWQELAKVPLIVWTPNMEAKTISKLSSTFDVAPTLANLFNLSNYDYYHTFGIDIFSADEAIVTFDNYGWITEHARNNVWSEYTESYDEIGTEAYINEMNNYVLERFQIGQEILKDNYFLEK